MQGSPARVISVSSDVHNIGRVRLDDLHSLRHRQWSILLYANSKLANVLHMRELARR